MLCFWNAAAEAQVDGTGFKIAIVDTGLICGRGFPNRNVVEQLCSSRADRLTEDSFTDFRVPDNTPFAGPDALSWFDYERASSCKNGATSDYTSVDAAEVPRRTWHWSEDYNYHNFSASHGTNVAITANAQAPGARLIIVNSSFYNAASSAEPDYPNTDCGVHGPDETVPLIERPTRLKNCYLIDDVLVDTAVVSEILSAGNVASINFSAGSLDTNCNNGSAMYKNIVDQGTAVVAAVGNFGPNARVGHPACNPHVIAVGSVGQTGLIANYTSQVGNIDFFANDFTIDSYTQQPLGGTSFASPVVAGAFATLREALLLAGVPTSPQIVNQAKFALSQAAFNLNKAVVHTNLQTGEQRIVPIVDFPVLTEAVRCIGDGSCLVDTGNGIFDEIDYFDGGQYGSIHNDVASNDYTFNIDFDSLSIGVQSQNIPINAKTSEAPSGRDVVLSFDGKMATNSFNGFRIFINNTRRETIGNFLGERAFSYTFKRTLFDSGNNTIRIEPTFDTRLWGVSNVKADFTSVVPLALNLPDRSTYGSDENPERPTGMRASFELEDVDSPVIVTATGLGINTPDEIDVYVNGQLQGSLDNGTSFATTAEPNFFPIAKEDLLVGLNVVEFVQKENAVGGWEVFDLLVAADTGKPMLQLGQINRTEYGNNFGTNENVLQLEVDFIPRSQSDHKISWKAFDIDRNGDLEVILNETVLKNVRTTSNGRFGTTETITIASRLFDSGANTLTFRTKVDAFDSRWGVTDLLVSPSSIINLDNSSSLNKTYGYFPLYTGGVPAGWTRTYSQEEYQSRLNAQFNNTDTKDRVLTVVGWDIDSPEEVAVYLNGTFLQYLTSTDVSSIFSRPDRITLPKDSLEQGTNTISLRTKDSSFSGFQSEKWAAKFTRLNSPSTDVLIVPILMMLLDDDPI